MANAQTNGSANANGQAKAEAVAAVADNDVLEVEAEVEESKPDPMAEFNQKLTAMQKELEEVKTRNKELGSKLTKEQQVRAELERFHTATLPELNKRLKPFDERWNDSPEAAVASEVQSHVAPVAKSQAATNAELWVTQVMVENPKLATYRDRAVALSLENPEYAPLTYSKKGIQTLFRLAAEEDLVKERDELKSRFETNQEKLRTFTEGSSGQRTPGQASAKPQVRLTAVQQQVAKKLGISAEDYMKRIGQVKTIGEGDWNE